MRRREFPRRALNIGDARFAAVAIDTTLASGLLKTQISNLGAYDGTASGNLTIDASTATPSFALQADLTGVARAAAAEGPRRFRQARRQDARPRSACVPPAAITARSWRACKGPRFVVFQDGAIEGLNVAQMIRSLTREHLVRLAGRQRPEDRPDAAVGVVQDRQGPGGDDRSHAGRPAGTHDRRRHHRARHQADRISASNRNW